MPDPAPLSLTEPAVAEWLSQLDNGCCAYADIARRVLALVEDRVRAALECADERDAADNLVYPTHDAIVATVMGRPS